MSWLAATGSRTSRTKSCLQLTQSLPSHQCQSLSRRRWPPSSLPPMTSMLAALAGGFKLFLCRVLTVITYSYIECDHCPVFFGQFLRSVLCVHVHFHCQHTCIQHCARNNKRSKIQPFHPHPSATCKVTNHVSIYVCFFSNSSLNVLQPCVEHGGSGYYR